MSALEKDHASLLKSKMSAEGYRKLAELDNPALFAFVGEYTGLCEPDSVYMCDDSDEDAEYIRQNSLKLEEEKLLAKQGHTIHYDGFNDQGRAPGATKNLVRKELVPLMGALLAKEREEGLADVRAILRGIMKGKQAIVKLSCEGPTHSPFSIACAQMTDSFYVAHSEELLYRRGYEHFRRMKPRTDSSGSCTVRVGSTRTATA